MREWEQAKAAARPRLRKGGDRSTLISCSELGVREAFLASCRSATENKINLLCQRRIVPRLPPKISAAKYAIVAGFRLVSPSSVTYVLNTFASTGSTSTSFLLHHTPSAAKSERPQAHEKRRTHNFQQPRNRREPSRHSTPTVAAIVTYNKSAVAVPEPAANACQKPRRMPVSRMRSAIAPTGMAMA